jgi:hypothetical protein
VALHERLYGAGKIAEGNNSIGIARPFTTRKVYR